METTRKQALKIIDIVKWVSPYDVFDCDKEEYIASIMEADLFDNLKNLNGYIREHYDVEQLLDMEIILRKKHNNLIKSIIRDLKKKRIDLLTENNFERNDDVIKQEKIILSRIERIEKKYKFESIIRQ